MKKLILIHDEPQIMVMLGEKYRFHIARPVFLELLPLGEGFTPSIEGFTEACDTIQQQVSGIFCVMKFNEDIDALHRNFNVFNIWTDPVVFSQNRNRHGIWLGDISEIDFAFNQLIPWIFD